MTRTAVVHRKTGETDITVEFCLDACRRSKGVSGSWRTGEPLYIDDICADEKARGQHVGKRLYEHVVGYAREIGCYNITLNVWSCNPGAMLFYERMGLVPYRVGMEKLL